MDAKDLTAAYDRLIERAADVCGAYVCENHMARISFDGVDAVISWPEASSGYYNSCSIETQKAKFPAYLLDATDSEVAHYKAEQKRLADNAARRIRTQRAKEQEERERQTLAQLQAKYHK